MSGEEPEQGSGESPASPLKEESDKGVVGERRIGSINRVRSLQSRISNVLAVSLLSLLAVVFLGWYYVHTFAGHSEARRSAQSTSRNKAQGDMPLPPLGPIEGPDADSVLGRALGPAPDEPPEGIPEAWLRPAEDPPPEVAPARPPAKTPEELAMERKLSGSAFSRSADNTTAIASLAMSSVERPEAVSGAGWDETGEAGSSELSALLKPGVTPSARARVLPTQRLLLPKGAFIDCTLETAIDSTLPGMTTCITATDTFGVDGSTVLMERGTKLVGETRGEVQQGAARLFVLWSEARTPTGVVIPLASPGTDQLGRSGLAGQVNRHFSERFGAAVLISTIEGAVQGAVQSSGGTVIYNPSTSEDIMTEVLKSTVNIPPTITKAHGDRIQILVARDLDFRSVYELKLASHAR